MAECCTSCQSVGIELGHEQRRIERQLEEIMRAVGGLRIGSADCDVNPIIASRAQTAAVQHLNAAHQAIMAFYREQGALQPQGQTDGR